MASEAMASISEWAIEFSSGIPAYRQIVNLIYCAIGDGTIREGDRLPTIKELSEQLKINPNTVSKAYRELDLKGIITSRRGDGSFLSDVTGRPKPLTEEDKDAKLDELFGRMIAEAKACGITEQEILDHIRERIQENE